MGTGHVTLPRPVSMLGVHPDVEGPQVPRLKGGWDYSIAARLQRIFAKYTNPVGVCDGSNMLWNAVQPTASVLLNLQGGEICYLG